MSLPFDISEKLKSVQVRHYVEWLGRDSHCGYGFAFGYDEKCYACVNAASYGDEALCTDLHAPTCQSAGISRKDLNHRPTRVNITTNRFSEGGACGWWQPYNMFAENI